MSSTEDDNDGRRNLAKDENNKNNHNENNVSPTNSGLGRSMLDDDLAGRLTMIRSPSVPRDLGSSIKIAWRGRVSTGQTQSNKSMEKMPKDDNQFGTSIATGLDDDIISYIAEKLRSNFLFLSLGNSQIMDLAKQFEVKEYDVGDKIIEQGASCDATSSRTVGKLYFYLLAEGECKVVKDGKQVHGKYGVIESGGAFGENSMVFANAQRSAAIVASKPSPNSDKVVVYRLEDSVFHDYIGPEAIAKLQKQIRDIQGIIDVLSGVNTKMRKGTIISTYTPSSLWLWTKWKGTILQYVWKDVISMMIFTALFGVCVNLIIGNWAHDTQHELLDQLEMIAGWWSILSGFATFVTTFFLSQAYGHWRDFYSLYFDYWLWSIIGVGLVTLFFKGIVKLSMMFLDPADNDRKHQDEKASGRTVGFDIGVLIRESNTGSINWKGAATVSPKYD